jgi:hypothetical protein
MGEGEEEAPRKRGPKVRLSGEKRARFLEVLGQTGNRRMAALAIGMDPRGMDQRREFDPVFDRDWAEAVEQADRRLAGASGPLDCVGGEEPMVIRRGPGGKLRLVRAGGKRWSRPVEERFFATLAACGNIAASARAVGFTESCIAQRRRKFPDFARRLEEALEDAELEVEFRLASEVRSRRGRGSEVRPSTSLGTNEDSATGGSSGGERPFDLDAAIRFLKWREAKRSGRAKTGRNGRMPREPSPDEVAEKIIRKVAAIKRQRARDGRGAEGGDTEGGDSH